MASDIPLGPSEQLRMVANTSGTLNLSSFIGARNIYPEVLRSYFGGWGGNHWVPGKEKRKRQITLICSGIFLASTSTVSLTQGTVQAALVAWAHTGTLS